jgi:ABC-2 type transport system permease protein
MRSAALAERNLKEMSRDPLSLGLTIALPVVLYVALWALGDAIGEADAPDLTPTALAPGVVLFGFVMLMFSSAMLLARDRENALFARLLTSPLTANDFTAGYSVPYVPVAIVQAAVIFAIGALLGMEMSGNAGLVMLVLLLMAVLYIALGIIFGVLLTVTQTSIGYTVVLLLTIFGGAWFSLQDVGGAFQAVADVLPFAHALDAMRAVMIDGAGFGDIAGDLAWVAGYAVVFAVVAVVVFRRRMVE